MCSGVKRVGGIDDGVTPCMSRQLRFARAANMKKESVDAKRLASPGLATYTHRYDDWITESRRKTSMLNVPARKLDKLTHVRSKRSMEKSFHGCACTGWVHQNQDTLVHDSQTKNRRRKSALACLAG